MQWDLKSVYGENVVQQVGIDSESSTELANCHRDI